MELFVLVFLAAPCPFQPLSKASSGVRTAPEPENKPSIRKIPSRPPSPRGPSRTLSTDNPRNRVTGPRNSPLHADTLSRSRNRDHQSSHARDRPTTTFNAENKTAHQTQMTYTHHPAHTQQP